MGVGVLTNPMCCPRCAGLTQGAAHPALHAQLRNLSTQQKEKCLFPSNKRTNASWAVAVGCSCPPAPRQGREGFAFGTWGLAGPGSSSSLCVTTVPAHWNCRRHGWDAVGRGHLTAAEAGELAKLVKGVKKGALHLFKVGLKLCMFLKHQHIPVGCLIRV